MVRIWNQVSIIWAKRKEIGKKMKIRHRKGLKDHVKEDSREIDFEISTDRTRWRVITRRPEPHRGDPQDDDDVVWTTLDSINLCLIILIFWWKKINVHCSFCFSFQYNFLIPKSVYCFLFSKFLKIPCSISDLFYSKDRSEIILGNLNKAFNLLVIRLTR